MTEKLSLALVEWFNENKRDLPWRKTENPYFIWISEVMLQQTQVDTVIPYYERFITQFPTMFDLARADEDVLLKEWEGLGYYSRARNLQAGVREVVEHYGAVVPKEKKELLKVKGIGPYTAGAILSIAYKQPEPAVDGNVMRVASRLFYIQDDISKVSTRKLIEEKIKDYIPGDYPSEFNQALMELGAIICKPKTPDCSSCPIASYCAALKKGVQTDLPIKKRSVKQKKVTYSVIVLKNDNNEFYIRKRPARGLLAGLWEFPMIEANNPGLTKKYVELFGVTTPPDETDIRVSHTFSHLKWDLNVLFSSCSTKKSPEPSGKWVSQEELEEYPFSVPHQKIKNSIDRFILPIS
ncbi:MAG: A/G-specific adenine glycosylase [Tuberibacillus sp.]